MNRTTAWIFFLVLGALFAPGVTAWAGPQIVFGPNEEGMLQIDYKGQFQMIMRDTGSGPTGEDDTMDFSFRRNRLAFMGAYGDVMSIYVQTEFTENSYVDQLTVSNQNTGAEFSIIDAAIRFDFREDFKLNVGKFKYSFNRESLEDCVMPLTLDRSLFMYLPSTATRDQGVGVWGNLSDGLFQYRADIMEGRQPTTSDAIAPESNFRYSVRGHVSLLDPEKNFGYKGTYLGKMKVLTLGAAYEYEANMAYNDTVAMTGPVDYTGWTADAYLEYPVENVGTFTASFAYEKIDLEDAYKGANPDPLTYGMNGQKDGWYLKAGYMLPDTPLQFFGRYEEWNFAHLQGIFDQDLTWYSVGLNYYLWGQNLKLTAEFNTTDYAQEDAVNKDFNTVIAQLQLIF